MQARLASGEDIFGPLIQQYLLKNTHRIRVDTLPDEELAAKQEADEKQRLGDIRRRMDDTQQQGVIAETIDLQHRQVSSRAFAAISFELRPFDLLALVARGRNWHYLILSSCL